MSCAALAVALASDAWAGGKRGFSGGGVGTTACRAFQAPAASSPSGRHFHRFHRFPTSTLFIGGFWFPYSFYYPPAYYYPPPVYYEPPPVYIQQQPLEPGAQPYWYYCPNSRAYYPYVKECPGGWDRVPAQPSDPSPTG